MDYQLGLFFQFLKDEGIYDNSLIIMAADHGESLGQHGEQTHGYFIYEPTVRVPLIIHAPFRFPAKRVKETVELVDITPTILDALGVPFPKAVQGESLLGLMFEDKPWKRNTAYTETYYPRMHFGWSELKALYRDGNWKFILAPKEELYDVKKDSGESDNLALKKSYEARKIKEEIEKFMREKSQNAQSPVDVKNLDRDDMEKLAALGYLTTMVDTTGKENLPDPKGKVQVFNSLNVAKELMAKEKYDESISMLKKILETEPNLVDGILQLGNAYAKARKYEDALKCFYEVLKQKPDYNAAMINILNSLERLGQYDKALEESQKFLKIFPNDHTLYNEIGNLYFLKQDFDKAVEALNTSIGIDKTNPHAYNKMAGIYILKKDYEKARSFLEKAFKINPNLRTIRYNMAQVEEAVGNVEKAMEYYKTELEHYPKDYKSAYNLAEDLRNRGRYEEAIKYYQESIDNNPHFNIPYFMVAKYYLDRRDQIDKAIEMCNTGIEIKPQNKYTVFGYYILSDIYSYRGNKSASNSFYSKGEALKKELERKNLWDRK